MLPRYPIYVISKGRADNCLTAKFLIRDEVPFKLVIEPQEAEAYGRYQEHLAILPFSNLGLGSIPARNWVWEDSKAAGAERHWILDDNIRQVHRSYKGKRFPCASGPAISALEDFTDRYENVAISGMNYHMFGVPGSPPFVRNVHVYSFLLIQNDLPYRWRGRYNEDADLCLQVLSNGWCTLLFNVFLAEKMRTMTMQGGNSDQLYAGDGRLKMARSLERVWPYVVATQRRFKRPQHVIKNNWRCFDTPLKRKPGLEIPTEPNEYGLALVQKADEIKSPVIRRIFEGSGGVPEVREPKQKQTKQKSAPKKSGESEGKQFPRNGALPTKA